MPSVKTSTYTPTFMEKILGKNYKWFYLVVYNFRLKRTYLGNTIMWTLFWIFSLLGGFFVWWITTKDNQNFDTSMILTYLFVGNMIGSFINSWPSVDLGVMNQTGQLSSKLLTPSSFVFRLYFRYIGSSMLANFSTTVIGYLLCLPILWSYLLPPTNLLSLLFVFLLLPISYTIAFFMSFIFGCITFWMTELEGANTFYFYFRDFTAGKFTPLNFLIPFVFFITYQPFAWLLHHPMQIYLGNYDLNQTLWVFAGGLAWCIVLYFLAKFVFKMGLKKNESVGL